MSDCLHKNTTASKGNKYCDDCGYEFPSSHVDLCAEVARLTKELDEQRKTNTELGKLVEEFHAEREGVLQATRKQVDLICLEKNTEISDLRVKLQAERNLVEKYRSFVLYEEK